MKNEFKVNDKYTGWSPDGHIDEYTVALRENGEMYLKGEFGRDVEIKAVNRLRKGGILK